MMLRPRAVVTAAALAVPIAAIAVIVAERSRTNDAALALGRVVQSQVNAQVRERCESDPKWFLTGPLEGRPPNGVFVSADPDALQPRPKLTNQGFELFGYDEQFGGSSSAAPRFPQEFRVPMRVSGGPAFAPYDGPEGRGVQVALATGWNGSPCTYFVGRMAAAPDHRRHQVLVGGGAFALTFLVTLLAGLPVVTRVRRVAKDARDSVNGGWTTIAPDTRKDELSSITFVYNDAINELKLRKSRIDDLDAALRRLVQSTDEEIAEPLRTLEATTARAVGDAQAQTRAAQEAHDLSARVENLVAASRLRLTTAPIDGTHLNLNELVARVVDRHRPMARLMNVSIELSLPDVAVAISADEALIARAISNVVDNAIRYSEKGGRVAVTLAHDGRDHRFRLFVANGGGGMSEENFRTLTAIRRFRGDENRTRRPGAPGLGLAVAREIADRSGLQFDLKRPAAGGIEAELSGKA